MPVQGSMQSFTAVLDTNSPAGTDSISNQLDNYLRSIQGVLRQTEAACTLTSTASMSLGTAYGYCHVVGTASVSHLGTQAAGIYRTLVFDAAATLIPSANILLPASATYIASIGDVMAASTRQSARWPRTSAACVPSPSSGASWGREER